jgi:hypothetical protein
MPLKRIVPPFKSDLHGVRSSSRFGALPLSPHKPATYNSLVSKGSEPRKFALSRNTVKNDSYQTSRIPLSFARTSSETLRRASRLYHRAAPWRGEMVCHRPSGCSSIGAQRASKPSAFPAETSSTLRTGGAGLWNPALNQSSVPAAC